MRPVPDAGDLLGAYMHVYGPDVAAACVHVWGRPGHTARSYIAPNGATRMRCDCGFATGPGITNGGDDDDRT
jgi:hypothetical protein